MTPIDPNGEIITSLISAGSAIITAALTLFSQFLTVFASLFGNLFEAGLLNVLV